MITKAQNSSGCESKVYNITPESCFDKRVEDFRIKEIEFNPITKKLVIKQSPDVIISTDILQLNDVSEPTHLSPVEDIVDNIPSNAESGVSYILRVEDKYYHCTWRDTLKYWDRIQLKDGYEFFNKKDSKEYRYNNGALVDISTIHLSMKINQDNIQILNSSGDGVTLPVASPTTPGLFSKEDKTKLDSITKYVKEISFSGADTLVLDIVSSDGTKSLPIREANINQNGLMSKEACLNLSRLLNTVTNNIYTKEEVQELLNKKVDVAPGKDLLDTSQIFKINQIFDYVENVEYAEANNRASLKVTTKDPTIGESSSKILSFPDVSSAISGLMSPKYKDYIDSLKSYYTGDPTKEYTGQDLQIIFPIYDPISKKVTSKYLVLDAATSSTAGLITAMEKNKLGNISSIVQAVSDNTYNSNSVILNLVTNNPQTGVEEPVQIVFKSATPEKAGVMSSSDKGKLDNVVKYLTDLIDTDTTSATQAIIHYQSYNPFLNTYEDKYYSLPMATSTIAGSITSTDFDVIQGLKDVNGTPLTYEGTPSKTWKIGNQILKNEKEGFSVRNEDDTEYGDLIVRNLTIKEDIVFGGDAFIIDTEEVKVTDNLLTLNSGEQGNGVTKGISGLEIDRGKLPNYFIIFDESDDRFKCGTEGNQFPLMLRDNEPDMVDGALLTWNSTFKRAQTTSTVPIQLGLRFALQNLSEEETDLILKRIDNDFYLQYGNSNDKYLSFRVLDDILFKSSPSATKYIFDKEIWAPAFKREDGFESAYIDPNISDRMFLQYDAAKKIIKSSNTVYSDKGGLVILDDLDSINSPITLLSNAGQFSICKGNLNTPDWNFVISSRFTRESTAPFNILDIKTFSHNALGFTNPIILDYVNSYIGFGVDDSHKFYGDAASFTFAITNDIIRFIPSPDRSLINTNSPELGFNANVILPTGFRTSDLSQILFANYANLNKKYLNWDSNTTAITSIDGFDSLVVINPEDQNKKVVLSYINGGFSISSSSDVPNVPQNTIEISETIGAGNSVTYNLNSTYTPLHINFPMWGEFCDANGKPFATVESLVGHYLPLVAGPTNALTGDLYFQKDYVNIISTQSNGQMSFSSLNELSTWDITFSMNNAYGFGGFEFSTTRDYFYFTKDIYVPSLNIDTDGDFFGTIYGDFYNEKNTLVLNADGDLLHEKGEHTYTIYDSSNLNVEELLQNYTLEGNIIGTPKTTRIKGTTIPSGSDFINNFRELIWGTNDNTTWIVPFRSNSADSGLGGAYAANLGWSLGDTHAYISVSYQNDIRSVIIGGGSNGKINWFEQVAFKSDINKLSSKYYPYSGRGHMTIGADGRPILANNQGILFNRTSGVVEGIYVTPNNHLNIGGSQSNNVPVDIYNKLNVNSISTTREQLGLLGYHPTDWTGVTNAQVGVGTLDSQLVFRSNSSDLLHYRDSVHCLIFDSYNFSRNLGTTSLNSSFNHFPMMAAQPTNSDATTDRGYPIQQAGSLIVIPGVYNGSSQIYGTYDSNRWFVRSGSPTSNNENEHTAWKELATTTHLSGYLPLTGGTLTGSLNIGDSSQNVYNYIRIRRNNYTFETTVSEGSGILSLDSSNSGVTPTMLKISPGGHAYINDEELATTSRLSNYLPLSGGVLSGSNRIVLRINSPSSVPAVDIVFSIGNSIKSSVGFELGTLGAFLSDNVSDKVFCLKNGPEIRTNSGTLIGKIPYKSDLDKYLPLSGGTLTGRLTVPRINTNYIESIDGNALVAYHQAGVDGVTNAQVGVGTLDSQLVFRSNSSDLLHYRDSVHCLIFDSYNFSRNLGTTSLNSSFNHFPMMAAQPTNSDATTDRGYPIQQAGSLIVIPGVYNGSSQIYGTYDSNRWFVRSGSPTSNNENEHTAWKELATTTHLSGYLPLTGGTLTGSLNIGDSSQNVYNYIRIRRNNYTFETTVSEGSGILSLDSSNSGVTPTMLKISPGGHAYINDEELATTSRLSNYLPLSGGVLSGSNRIVLRINSPSSVPAVDIVFSIGNSIKSSVGFELGTLGAFLSDNVSDKVFCLKNGPEIRTNSGTLIGKIPYKSDLDKYLPLSGGTLTGRLTVPRINTNYIESIDGNALVAYHQAGVDGVTNAQVGIGTVVDQMILRSSNTNLMHYKNGTQYTILDTSNIAALTIQFNGSTNTTYAPNAAKTVNITPAAIGAAAVGHTHVMSDISGLSLAWSSITGKPETATRWPSWSEVTNKPINPSYSFGGNNDSITTAQFLTHLQNLGAFSTGFGIYRGSWSYIANQSITDTGVGVIHLAGSTVEVIGNSASNCTIRVTVPTTSGNGTTKRIYVYCNNGDDYKPGWFAVARTDELTWNSISGKPSTFTPSSHTHTKSQITDFPSSMPASDVYAWAKAPSKPSYSWSEITSKPSTFTPSSHTHPLSGISDLQASWDALLKAAPSAYVTRWPSWSEVTSKPSFATVATSGSYNDLSNKPSIPSAETAATIMSKINSQSEITFTKHVVCSAGAGLQSTSDIRFKSNFNSLPDDTLNKVLNAPEFTYNWKDETTTSIGTSAQYWEDKIPELVHEMEDGTKTFSYERYTVVLQKALKEEHRLREEEKKRFKEEIDSLNTRLNDLTSLIQKLI